MAVTVHSWTCWGINEFRFLLLRCKLQLSQAGIVACEWDFHGAQGSPSVWFLDIVPAATKKKEKNHEVMNAAHALPILQFCLLHDARCISCLSKFMIKQYFYCVCQNSNRYADFHDLLINPWHLHGTDQLLPHLCWTVYWFMELMHSKLIFMRSICGYTFRSCHANHIATQLDS